MTRLALALLCVAAALPSAARAQAPGTVYAFGDSLTDNGNIPHYLGGFNFPPAPYYKNHFSNGPVFVEYLPALIGARFAPGDDYGVGGAFAGNGNLVPLPQLPGTAQEIAAAAAAGLRFSSADTVLLWAGSNNYFAVLGGLPPGTTVADPTVQADLRQVSGFIASDASRLIGLGARRLVVLNVPDLGATPSQTAAGDSLLATGIARANNALLTPALNSLAHQTGANIYLINAQLGIDEILADPARYGIVNTTQECILTPACVNGSRAVQNSFLFWDGVHPTTGVHDFLAHVVANQLQAGGTIGGQTELMIVQAEEFADGLAQRLAMQRAAAPQTAGVSVYLQGHYASGNRDAGGASNGFSYETGTILAGVDGLVAPGLIVGAAAGYGQPSALFKDGAGKLGFAAYQGGVYASLSSSAAYVDITGAYSRFGSGSGERPGVLAGDVLRFSPGGRAWSAGASTGLTLHAGNLVWGPVGALDFTNAAVSPYGESGEALLTQTVARQSVDSLVGQAGLQAAVDTSVAGLRVRPHWLLAAEREFLDARRIVQTSFTSAGLPIGDALAGYTGTYGRIGFGAVAGLGRALTATIDAQATFGRGNGEDHSVLLKLDAAF